MRLATLLLLLATTGFAAPVDFHGDALPPGAIARLGSTRFLPPGTVHSTALSPDGKMLAILSYEQKLAPVRVDGKKGVPVRDYITLTWLEILDPATGQVLSSRVPEKAGGDRLHFSPDSKSMIFQEWNAFHWTDPTSGKKLRSVTSLGSSYGPVGFSACGDWLAVQPRQDDYHGPVQVFETQTGKHLLTLDGRGASSKQIVFGHGGRRVLLASIVPNHMTDRGLIADAKARLALCSIDTSTGKIAGETDVDSGHFFALGADGETVACETADRKGVRVLHLPSGAERCRIAQEPSRFALTFDGKALFTVDAQGLAALWDTATGEKLREMEGTVAARDFDIAGISQDGQTIVITEGGWRSQHRVVVWNATTGRRATRPTGHSGTVTTLAYAPDGKTLVSGSVDKTVRLWNATTGEHLRLLATHKEAITALAFSPDGRLVAAASACGLTHVTRVADGKVLAEVPGYDRGAQALTFSLDGKALYVGGHTSVVLAWDIATNKESARFSVGENRATGVLAFTSGGGLALAAQSWGPVPWNLRKSQAGAIIMLPNEAGQWGQTGMVECDVANLSPEGRLVATSQVSAFQGIRPSYDVARLCLWERSTGQPIRTLAPTVSKFLAFSPGGRLLASGDTGYSGHLKIGHGDGVVLWDTLTGSRIGEIATTPEVVAFSPDGRHLATGGRHHCVLIWKTPKPAIVVKAATPAQCAAWWPALEGPAKEAYTAIGEMVVSPDEAVAVLREKMRPVVAVDAKAVARWIPLLDDEKFEERERGQRELEKLGEGAAHLVTKSLEGKPSAEASRRLEAVLAEYVKKSEGTPREDRAMTALESIDTPASRELLRALAEGAPGARLTGEAKAVLQRGDRHKE